MTPERAKTIREVWERSSLGWRMEYGPTFRAIVPPSYNIWDDNDPRVLTPVETVEFRAHRGRIDGRRVSWVTCEGLLVAGPYPL